jgi:hypothetical protein
MIVVNNVLIPSRISIAAPNIEIHLRKRGALFSSQPVVPPRSRIGDKAVPKPNKIAKMKLSNGDANATEVSKSASNGAHITKPLDKPNEKARKSSLLLSFSTGKVPCAPESRLQDDDLPLSSMWTPIIIVTMPNATDEYV